jgi:hypothetical protein
MRKALSQWKHSWQRGGMEHDRQTRDQRANFVFVRA